MQREKKMTSKQTTKMIVRILHDFRQQDRKERIAITTQMLLTLEQLINELKEPIHETKAVQKRRKAKSRETAVDPKPPVKPVRVAEPSKPKKPKYSGL
jgi:anthranilate phosphoribosyltransferase